MSEALQTASGFEQLDVVVIGDELEAIVAATVCLDSGLSVILLGPGLGSEELTRGAAHRSPSHTGGAHEADDDSAVESRHRHSSLGSELLSQRELTEAIDVATRLVALHSPNGDPLSARSDRALLSEWFGSLSISNSTQSYLELLSRVVLAAEPTETSANDAIRRLADASWFRDAVEHGIRHHEGRTFDEIEERMREMRSRLGWRVMTDVEVKDVQAVGVGVQVSTSDGVLQARTAIVVTPRSGKAAVTGTSLSSSFGVEDHPQARTNLVEVRLHYKTSLWGQLSGLGRVLYMSGIEALVFDSSQPAEDTHVLVAYVQGSHADAFRGLSPSTRQSALMDAVSFHLGGQARIVEQYVEIDWLTADVSTFGSNAGGALAVGSHSIGGPGLRVCTLASLPMVNSIVRLHIAVDRAALAARMIAVNSISGTSGAGADWIHRVLDWRENQVGLGSVRAHPTSAVVRRLIVSNRCGEDLLQELVHTLDSGFGDGDELNRLLTSSGAGFRIFECRNLAGPYWDFEPANVGPGGELESSQP